MRASLTRHSVRLALCVVVVAFLPSVGQASHTATRGQIRGFEIDGDFAFPHAPPIAGATRDWVNVGGVSGASDPADDANDNVFKGGSKEQTPDTWTFSNGPKPPGKDDLTRFYAATDVNATFGALFLGFERLDVSGGGDAHANFEFNQKTTTIVNSEGFAIPERTVGDLLVIYDYAGGGNAAGVEVRRWTGTPLAGAWVLQVLPPGSARADVNGAPVTRPAAAPFGGGTVDTLRFAEAALDLTAIFGPGFPGCPGFAQFSVKTRASGESFNSELKDRSEPIPISMSRCPDVHIAKSASAAQVDVGDSFTYTLTASNAGIVPAAGVTVTDNLPDTLTGVSATYDVDPNTAGGTGACVVGAGNAVTCPIGVLAASDGNSTGAEPDVATVTIAVTAPAAACGVLRNVAHVDATNELISDQSDNDSNVVVVEVRCASIAVTKVADAVNVSAGEPIGFTITVTNNGNGTAHGVVVNDPLPGAPGTTWSIDGGSAASLCSIVAGTLGCTLGSLSAGSSQTVHVSSPTTASSCGVISNTASVTTTNDGSGQSSATTTVLCPDVRIRKSTTTAFVSAGDTVSYDLIVDNLGAGSAFNVVVSDTLPAGLSWSISPAVAGCSVAAGALTCTISSLVGGASIAIHLVATTDASDCGTLSNSASVSATNEAQSALGNNSAGPVLIVVNCALIDIDKTPDAAAVTSGTSIGFTITVTNSGAGQARDVTVRDTLPLFGGADWSIDGGSAAGSCSISSGALTCSLGTLASGASATVHISSPTTAASCGVINNEALVRTSNDGSDTASASITVSCPDLRISKTADDTLVSSGDPVGFTVTVSNLGPGDAVNVTLNDPLPAGFAWSIAPPVTGCQIASGTLSCSFGTLTANASRSVQLSAVSDPADCGSHPNTATASAANHSSVRASASITVQCSDLRIAKTADALVVSAGDSIGFTITVSNAGLGDAYGVTLNDPLPATPGTTWTINGGTAASDCQITTGTLSCSFGTLGAGASRSVHVSSPTTAASCSVVDNTATASASNDESGQASASVTVQCPAIAVLKTADDSAVSAGESIGFTITVSNAGPGSAHAVTLNDPLPATAGTVWTIDGGTGAASCSIGSGTLTCSFGTLGEGTSRSVHVSSPTTSQSCGVVNNTATVSATNDGSEQSSAQVNVACASLGIVKAADAASVSAGDPIGFTITVSNAGPGDAFAAALNDPLPQGNGIGWTIDGGTAAASCQIVAGTLTCSFGTLGSGASASVHVSSPTTKDSCGTYSNTATASASNHASVIGVASTAVDCAQIALVKTADSASVNAGQPIGFTISVRNDGQGEARGVTVTDTLPVATELAWAIDGGTMQAACGIAGGVLTCIPGTLAAGASATVHIASPTTGDTCGEIPNVANVTTSNDGLAQANATIVVNCPAGIAIVKTGVALAHVGDTVGYVMVVSSLTITPLDNVSVADANCIDSPLYVSGDDGDDRLEPGETWMFTCSHRITATDPDPLPNTATATGTGNGVEVSAQDDHLVDIIHPAIVIDKTANPLSGNPGDTVVYTYVVRNIGDTTLYGVTVTDDKLGFIGTIGTLTPGQSKMLQKSTTLGTIGVTNIGTASGIDILQKRVTDTDPASVTVVLGNKLVATGTGPVGWRLGLIFLLAGVALLGLTRYQPPRRQKIGERL